MTLDFHKEGIQAFAKNIYAVLLKMETLWGILQLQAFLGEVPW